MQNQLKTINKKLKFGIVINSLFTIFEFIVGSLSGSLSLISDATHNLTDVISLIIALIANKIAQKKPSAKKTFGYGRATILASLIDTSILTLLSFYIFKEAYFRFYNPVPVEGYIVMLVGFLGILVNGSVALLFYKHKEDLNIASALLNMTFDAIASAGALLAGLLTILTGYTVFDSIIAAAIGLMLLIVSIKTLSKVINILLEGVPHNIEIDQVYKIIKAHDGVNHVGDLHVWAISSHYAALSCHININSEAINQCFEIIKQIKQKLKQEFNIVHTTIEVTYEQCQINCVLDNQH